MGGGGGGEWDQSPKYVHFHYPHTSSFMSLETRWVSSPTHICMHSWSHSPSSSCILITVTLGVPSSTPVGALLRLSVAISSSTTSRATLSSLMGNVMSNELVPAGKVAVTSMDPPDGAMNWVSLRAVCVCVCVWVSGWVRVCVCARGDGNYFGLKYLSDTAL